MATWPEWRFDSQINCRKCETVFLLTGRVSSLGYCPLCWPEQSPIYYDKFRWVSTSVWWQPWTWRAGYWLHAATGAHYRRNHNF